MDKYEYEKIQELFTLKLKNHNGYCTNKEESYNNGVLACKSILKAFYENKYR